MGPLDGVRVIELPAIGPVPFLGMMLADLGAEVIRIDKLSTDDDPMSLLPVGPHGPMGRGRRSVGLDLRKPGASEVLLRLVESADALIEGFRPGVTERLGVGPAQALARNPKLVYGRMTGWGQDGPLAPRAGHDINYLAVSGLLHGIGAADAPPVPPANYLADFGGGAMSLAVGLLAGVLHARSTGTGQVIDAAMTDGAAYLGTMTRVFMSGDMWSDQRGANLFDGGSPNYRCYECADGKYVAVGAIEPQFWMALLATLGLDAATVGSPWDGRDWERLTKTLAETFATRTRDEWDTIFAEIDGCVAPVLTLAEAPDYPHNAARNTFTTVGTASVAAPAPRFSVTPATAAELGGALGAETITVLEDLGFSQAEINELRAASAIN
ncbi:alpha-methylacyl-CoA racemase [Jatrophihabitans sp. GAS493]|uniref:CaiB/BaiF CoA transferase family protein n=1 Tax=Jatrophihabitans sp. GAS493 TaxID=1907575 RepID=UPI000BB83734|nr:CaiB/BaiF CoA-transferase family protein [Jatrophihabitans sp. GAS493]SOD73417.1 alpha-methylacyl-CoA racemase [Jatrophihabitans sp. GAS493]